MPTEKEIISKKCPVCDAGEIVFDELMIEGWGECNNPDGQYGYFEIVKLKPLTVKYIQEPLRTYLITSDMPWIISEKGLRFSVRDATDEDKITEAINSLIEGVFDFAQNISDYIDWDQIDWDDYVEEDDGITVYVLEDLT
ncbi:MAG: hypothetical protein CMA11_01395 [Euryarchaeota archaeon]|nr:hypothetical protein [Euryarchaeota archaeon]